MLSGRSKGCERKLLDYSLGSGSLKIQVVNL
jgi:hypothetical protein